MASLAMMRHQIDALVRVGWISTDTADAAKAACTQIEADGLRMPTKAVPGKAPGYACLPFLPASAAAFYFVEVFPCDRAPGGQRVHHVGGIRRVK